MSRSTNRRCATNSYSSLEPRQMLATVTLSDGALQIVGTLGNDVVEVIEDSDGQSVRVVDGSETLEFAKADVSRIEFRGQAGNDDLRVIGLKENISDGFPELEFIGFYGGDGDDSFYLSLPQGDVTVIGIGGDGNDVLEAEPSNSNAFNATPAVFTDVTFFGNGGDDVLRGGRGNDRLVGNEGMDQIFGGYGSDTILGGDGDDLLDGGSHDDEIVGGAGDDEIFGGDQSFGTIFSPPSFTTSFVISGGNDRLVGGLGDDTINAGDGDDVVLGGEGADVIRTGLGDDLVYAGADDDEIVGEDGKNEIYGQAGADIVTGGSGDDSLYGGTGNDTIAGLDGNDLIYGGTGDDSISGDNGDDRIFAGPDNDTVYGGSGNDLLNGFAGNDRLFGGADDDVLVGGQGADVLNGHTGNDTMLGGDGDDHISALSGRNYLNGGDGDDDLRSRLGADRIVGGNGADSFFASSEDSIVFVDGEDRRSNHFFLGDFIGLTLRDASDLADSVDRPSRVSVLDGEPQILTQDSIPNRLNFDVANGLVVGVRTDAGAFAGHDSLLADFIGLNLENARDLADSRGRDSRVSLLDGESRILTADYIPNRLNFAVVNNLVVGVRTDSGVSTGYDSHLAGFVGLTLQDAGELADTRRRTSRISVLDGEPQIITADYIPNRLNFEIADNLVVRVTTDAGSFAGYDFLLVDFIGLTQEDAGDLAESRDRLSRISVLNGERKLLPTDFVPNRLNFEVEDGLVVRVIADAGASAGYDFFLTDSVGLS